MIETVQIKKSFEGFHAVEDVSITMREGNVFGLIGTNGAGKSTVLRMMAGILKPDSGKILIDEMPVWENEEAKKHIFFISDDQYFFANAKTAEIGHYYKSIYKKFDWDRFLKYMEMFGLDKNRKVNTFSKGMKKQLSIICGICANTKYLFCDETFDGLDPVMRQGVKSIFAGEIETRQLTPVIASHNLRELEDICDQVGILHKGGILISKDLDDMKSNIHKVQCVFLEEEDEKDALAGFEILQADRRGSLITFTVRGDRDHILSQIKEKHPVFYEALPLSLEEIFISETEVAGYDIKKLIL